MSYIRGALPFLIYNPNTRDDILPDGISSSFKLSQEVPGGYENNIQVIRREFKNDPLIQSCAFISFNRVTSEISCDVPAIAAALSFISVGDRLKVEGAAESSNNANHDVLAVNYDGETIVIQVASTLTNESEGNSVTLTRYFIGPWEVLEPIVDYTISGTADDLNKIINLAKCPKEDDFIYVLHRGEATYNFVPTEKSVGPAQLSENLRKFQVDVFVGDGATTDFSLTVQEDDQIVSARTLEVSVGGVVKYGSDVDLQFEGDFELLSDGKTIRFADAPSNNAKIYVRHLGFSTVSRRQFLSPSQIGNVAPKSIGSNQLQNNSVTEPILDDNAISSIKIRDGAVDGSKVLLQNNQWLNWKSGIDPSSSVSVIKVDASDVTTVKSSGLSLQLNVNGSRTIQVTTTAILDASASGEVSIGTPANQFANAYFAGQVVSQSAELTNLEVTNDAQITGDLAVSGGVSVSGNVNGIDIVALQAQVTSLAALVAQNTPAGSIKMWGSDTAAPAGYLLCDGQSYLTSAYPALFSAIGHSFGGSGSTFSVPDFKGRFPLGKAASGTGSGWGGTSGRGGSLDHTHTTPSHTHGLANHVHEIPSHYHSMLASSTLNITSSGGHTTSLDHNHGTITSSAGTAHTHTHGLVTSGATDGVHSHSDSFPTVGSVDLRHWHAGSTQAGEGAHLHSISKRGFSTASGHIHDSNNSRRDQFSTAPEGANASDTTAGYTGGGTNEGSHAHSLTTGTPYDLANNATSLNHSHSTTVTFTNNGGHSHTVTGGINNESAHAHTITIPSYTQNSSSGGTHTHDALSFAGAIGNVASGSNGNSAFNSGAPSTNSTDAGGAGVSGSSNPAFQTINFVIKT